MVIIISIVAIMIQISCLLVFLSMYAQNYQCECGNHSSQTDLSRLEGVGKKRPVHQSAVDKSDEAHDLTVDRIFAADGSPQTIACSR